MSPHIPNDILLEILARLPVKWLLRFTLVCKHWHSIIKNPSFITMHLDRFGNTSTDHLLVRMLSKSKFLLLSNDESFDENYVELDLPHYGLRQCFSVCIMCSCNGLICLYNPYNHIEVANIIIVWNPCIRKSVTLMPRKISPINCHIFIGFGFSLVKNMFKVIIIIYNSDNKGKLPPEVEVYDQGGSEWRMIGRAPPHYSEILLNCMSQVFFNGSVHWVAENKNTYKNIIVAFEIGDEVFREIALPRDLPSCNLLYITVYKDSITVFGRDWGRNPSKIDKFHVWMMKDYGVFESWTNLYNIILPTVVNRPLGLRKDGKILFDSKHDMDRITSLDPDTGIITKSTITGMVGLPTVLNFLESLVLLT